MDSDLVAALGANPTPLEKLYAEAIEDSRANTVKWDEERQRLVDERQRMVEFRADMTAYMNWHKEQYALLPAPIFDDKDTLYERCVRLGVEVRTEGAVMSTSTSRAVMDDVIADGFYIGEQIYARVLAHKGL